MAFRNKVSKVAVSLFIGLAGYSVFAQQPPNQSLVNLADNSWFVANEIPSPGAQSGNVGAYSGFAFDPLRGRLIKRGGGHCDYSGTEVQEFDALNSLSWSIASPSVPNTEFLPSAHFNQSSFPGAVVVLPGGGAPSNFAAAVANGQAAPIARHTTNSPTFIESTGEFFMTGKYTYAENGSGCQSGSGLPYSWEPRDAWAYNTSTQKWRYLARHNIDMEWAGCVWVPNGAGVSDQQGAVFCIAEETRELHRYDVSRNAWTTVGSGAPASGLGVNLSYSSKFRSLYYFLNSNLYQYDISSNNWRTMSTTGSPSINEWAATAYDSVNDAVGVWDGGNLSLCTLSNASTCSWTTASRQNMPRGRSGGGVSSNFAYDSINNVFWAANSSSGTVYLGAFRFKTGGTSSIKRPNPPGELRADTP